MSARVLVVDDEADIRDTIIEILQDAGHEAVGAYDGRDALDQLAREPLPDLILLDLRMPVLDGQGFRAQQVKDPRLATIPVVVVSANSQVREVAEGMGAAGYLRKPVDLAALLRTTAARGRGAAG